MNTDRKVERWIDLTDRAPRFAHLRRPGPTRVLIAAYFGGLILAVAFLAATVFWKHFLWFHLATLIAAMAAWTILRSSIDAKDTAPEQVLDDYEQEVLAVWRRRSFSLFGSLLPLGAALVVSVGAFFGDRISVLSMSTFAGLYMIMLYLCVGTLPVVGYALTFNRGDADGEDGDLTRLP